MSVLVEAGAAVPTVAYRTIPLVALVAGGYALGRRTDRGPTRAGASVVLGYLPAVIVGTFAFAASGAAYGSGASLGTVEVPIAPAPLRATLFAGIALPIVYGAAGGYLAGDRAALRRASRRIAEGHRVERAAVAGAGSYLGAYALTYGLLAATGGFDAVADGVRGLEWVDAVDLGRVELAGWVLSEAHLVDVGIRSSEASRSLALLDGPLPVAGAVFLAIPAGALVVAGALIARRLPTRAATVRNGALAGASVAAGYLPLAVVARGVFAADATLTLVVWRETDVGSAGTAETIDAALAPDPLGTVLLAGLAFPLVLGAVGGVLGCLGRSDEDDPQGSE